MHGPPSRCRSRSLLARPAKKASEHTCPQASPVLDRPIIPRLGPARCHDGSQRHLAHAALPIQPKTGVAGLALGSLGREARARARPEASSEERGRHFNGAAIHLLGACLIETGTDRALELVGGLGCVGCKVGMGVRLAWVRSTGAPCTGVIRSSRSRCPAYTCAYVHTRARTRLGPADRSIPRIHTHISERSRGFRGPHSQAVASDALIGGTAGGQGAARCVAWDGRTTH